MYTLALYAALTATLFYLGNRAIVTRALWARYPQSFAEFMDCSACTGFWYGAIVASTIGYHFNLSYLGLPGQDWLTVLVVAFASTALTPISSGIMHWGLEKVGHAITTEDDL